MLKNAGKLRIARAICANPQIVKAKPSINWFFCQYLRKFKVLDVGGKLVLHSHLPPLNSKAYSRFVKEHLLIKSPRFSHAQVGITNACPQRCEYCYNKDRTGVVMDSETIFDVIRDLKQAGVFWIGLTGGEPLLNKDVASFVEAIGDDCASKIFTTGCGLTNQLAVDLKNAGLMYATVSLDDWREAEHDRVRNYQGAFRTALRAIEQFKGLGTIHVSVSAVLSREMLEQDRVEQFLEFLRGLEIHEAWLSEAKPSVQAYWNKDILITDEQRRKLIALQDRLNSKGGMTINYLSHFEDAGHFGCTAGHKMVYVDAFGEVSPCVFIPMTFGNVQNNPLAEILDRMRSHFPSENTCFINKNYEAVQRHFRGKAPLDRQDSLKVLDEVEFGQLAKFFELQYK